MIKKGLTFLLIFMFLINIAIAQKDPDDPFAQEFDETIEQLEKLKETGEKLTDKEKRLAYLRQEQSEILRKIPVIGPIILGIGNVLTYLSPIFKILIGLEYSQTWIFYISLFIWLWVFYVILTASMKMLPSKLWASIPIAIIIPTLAAQAKIIPKFIEFLSPLFTNIWTIIITAIVAIVVLVLFHKFLKFFGDIVSEAIKKDKESRREQKAQTVEKIHSTQIKASS